MADDLSEAALEYHRFPTPGKISVVATKPLGTQRDLALAYSPGVAAACMAIVANPAEAANVTARGNLVGVITNGTARRQAGNGRQGRPLQEIRRDRRVRYRDRCE
jgi:malate dehydrogenase (oxaloacetate-decarboxylating)(NADP+)